MLDSLKSLFIFKSVDKHIAEKKYDLAMEKLNELIKDGYRPDEVFLKRGRLCHELLMTEDAYSDFTYIISHCVNKTCAYLERMNVNFEMANYYEAIQDADEVLLTNVDDFSVKRIKLLSMIYSEQTDIAKSYLNELFDFNKYKSIQFLLNETALTVAHDELAKGLKLLDLIELIDPENPIKILKEANIYGIGGDIQKEAELMNKIQAAFPKYFISHFRFSDIYDERDLLEICFLLELKIFDKQNIFAYPMNILEGYKFNMEGHIIDSKESFEKAIEINPNKPEAYVLLGETLQLMSGYNNPELRSEAENNYKMALKIYEEQNLLNRVEEMKRQIRHLNSSISLT